MDWLEYAQIRIKELQEEIDNTPLKETEKIKELVQKREALERHLLESKKRWW